MTAVCSCLKYNAKDCLLFGFAQRARAPDYYLLSVLARRLWAKDCSSLRPIQRARAIDGELLSDPAGGLGCVLLGPIHRARAFKLPDTEY